MNTGAKSPRTKQNRFPHPQLIERPPIARTLYLRDDSSPERPLIREILSSSRDLTISIQEVSTEEGFRQALCQAAWEIILLDYQAQALPRKEALAVARSLMPGTPVIGITHPLTDLEVAETFKAGARDYILKSQPDRIVPSIQELTKKAERQQGALDNGLGNVTATDGSSERKNADQALDVEQARLSAILGSITDEIWYADTDMHLTRVNGAVRKDFDNKAGVGRNVKELAAQYEVYRGDSSPRPPEEAPLWRALRGETVAEEEEIVRTPVSRELRNRLVSANPVVDAQGKILGAVAVVRDITGLRRLEGQYRTIVQGAHEGIVIATPEGVLTFANRRMADLLGYTVEEMLGKSSVDYADPDWHQQVVQDRQGLCGGNGIEGEFKFRRKDGSALWTHYTASPILNEHGEHVANVAMHTDITGRKIAEDRIAHVARFPEENPHPILRVTPKGELMYANASSGVILKNWQSAVGKEIPIDWQQVIREAFSSGQTVSRDVQIEGRFYAFTIVPIASGPYVNLYGRDITRQKQMEAEIHKAEREKAELLESIETPLYGLDAEWRYTYVNSKAARFMGKDPAELLGKTVWDVFPQVLGSESERQLRVAMEERVAVQYETHASISNAWVDVYIFPKTDGGLSVLYRDTTQKKRSEEALRESNELLQRVLEVETVGVMFWDLNTGCMTNANDTFLNSMGYSRAEVEARELTWQRLTPPEYFELSQAEVRKFMATGRIGPYEKEYYRKDGTRQWFVFAGSSLGNNACVEFCVDISARKRAEEEFRKSEERYKTLFNSIDQGFFLIEVLFDADNHPFDLLYLEANRAATQILGRDYTGKRLTELSPDYERYWFDIFGEVALTGKSVRLERYAAPDKKWYSFYVFRIGGPESRRIGNTFLDITEEKRAAEALKASELNMHLMVNMASDAMVVVNSSGVIEAVSALGMRILGYEEKDMIGRSVAEFAVTFSRLDAVLTIENLRRRAPEPLTSTVRVRTKNGDPVWLSATASFVSLGTGSEKYFVKFQQVNLSPTKIGP